MPYKEDENENNNWMNIWIQFCFRLKTSMLDYYKNFGLSRFVSMYENYYEIKNKVYENLKQNKFLIFSGMCGLGSVYLLYKYYFGYYYENNKRKGEMRLIHLSQNGLDCCSGV